MSRQGIFITLEGPDGCGKSTQAKMLAQKLVSLGYRALHTREPGGTYFAEGVRRILLDTKHQITALAELFLYEASRAQHVAEAVEPALKLKKIVICERYIDATLAYQGYGRKLDKKMIQSLNQIATGGLKPQLTIVLDIDPKAGLTRALKNSSRGGDRLERAGVAFHQRVRAGYKAIAKLEPKRIRLISALGEQQQVHDRVWRAVRSALEIK